MKPPVIRSGVVNPTRNARAAAAVIAGAAVMLSLGVNASAASVASGHLVNPHTHLRAGVTPKVHPRSGSQPAIPSNAHLTYYGGHIISNVTVVQVLYGSGTYET